MIHQQKKITQSHAKLRVTKRFLPSHYKNGGIINKVPSVLWKVWHSHHKEVRFPVTCTFSKECFYGFAFLRIPLIAYFKTRRNSKPSWAYVDIKKLFQYLDFSACHATISFWTWSCSSSMLWQDIEFSECSIWCKCVCILKQCVKTIEMPEDLTKRAMKLRKVK